MVKFSFGMFLVYRRLFAGHFNVKWSLARYSLIRPYSRLRVCINCFTTHSLLAFVCLPRRKLS